MAKKVEVDEADLRNLLERFRDWSYAVHARHDRKTKSYPFTDEHWRTADADDFALYDRLRATLTR